MRRNLAAASLGFIVVVLLLQAITPAWMYHLRADVDNFYFVRAQYWLEHHDLTEVVHNEYPPGAMVFFIALAPALLLSDTTTAYLVALFAVNVALIALLGHLYDRLAGPRGAMGFVLLLLFVGPIVLYRFDLFVGLGVIGALLLWRAGRRFAGCALLGVATVVKIYPAILLPYLARLSMRKQGVRRAAIDVAAFASGLFGALLLYLAAFQVHPAQILVDLDVNARKPLHVESVWGTAMTFAAMVRGEAYPLGVGDLGLFGVPPEYRLAPLGFFNWFWVLPVGLFYLWLARRIRRDSDLDLGICATVLLLFLVFSKILAPQYLLWSALLLPLLPGEGRGVALGAWEILLLLAAAFLGQIVYPLNYDYLLAGFFEKGTHAWIFWALVARNACLVVLFFLLMTATRRALRGETASTV